MNDFLKETPLHLGPEKFECGLRCQWKERGGHIQKWYVIIEDQWQV